MNNHKSFINKYLNNLIIKRQRHLHRLLLCTLTMCTAINIQAQVDPGVDFDIQGFIDQKISAGETIIVIPAGRYRVAANGKNHHLNFSNLDNIITFF